MKVFKFGSSLVLIALLSACGSQSQKLDQSLLNNGTNGLGTGSGSQTGANGNGSSNYNNIYGLPNAPSATFKITGQNGTNPVASYNNLVTETVLRVKIKPLPAPNLDVPGYTNWVIPYGCVSFRVTVNGVARQTQALRVDGVAPSPNSPCANAPTSQILDFSDMLSGQGPVNISVEAANYDSCRLAVQQYGYQSAYQYYGCPMAQVWKSHPVAGTIQIQTNSFYMQ